jgi:DNA-binding PadR family transcriptional regulator
MDLDILRYFLTQGPFAVLFVWLFYSTRKEGQERERKLYQTIDDQNEVLRKFSEKYDVIIEKLDHLENKIKG